MYLTPAEKNINPPVFQTSQRSLLGAHELPNALPPAGKTPGQLPTGSEGHGISRLCFLVSPCHSLARASPEEP